jgi:hypothetical protein
MATVMVVLWNSFEFLSTTYDVSSVYFNCTLISMYMEIMEFEMFDFSHEWKSYVLCLSSCVMNLNSVHVYLLILKGDGQICFISSVFVMVIQHNL